MLQDSWQLFVTVFLIAALATFAGTYWSRVIALVEQSLAAMENSTLQRLEGKSAAECLRKALAERRIDSTWLSENKLEPLGVYKVAGAIGDPHLAIWKRSGERTQLRILRAMNRHEIEIITTFRDEGQLRTTTTKDSLLWPSREGEWVQAFSVSSVPELWDYHLSAQTFLRSAIGQEPSTADVDFEQQFATKVQELIAFLRSLRWWRVRLIHWYFVRRNRLYGKSVREQFEANGHAVVTTHP